VHLIMVMVLEETSTSGQTFQADQLTGIMNGKAKEHAALLVNQTKFPGDSMLYNHPFLASLFENYDFKLSDVINKFPADVNRSSRDAKSEILKMISIAERVDKDDASEVMLPGLCLRSGRTPEQYAEQTRKRIWTEYAKKNLEDLKPDSVMPVDYLAFQVLGPVSKVMFKTPYPSILNAQPDKVERKEELSRKTIRKKRSLALTEAEASATHSAKRSKASVSNEAKLVAELSEQVKKKEHKADMFRAIELWIKLGKEERAVDLLAQVESSLLNPEADDSRSTTVRSEVLTPSFGPNVCDDDDDVKEVQEDE